MTPPRPSLLAVVPARAGSKGIPGKNLAPVGGRPLIAWTLAAARESGVCARIVVTTDSPAIAAVARDHGGETPFLRPAELSGDEASSVDVVVHAVSWLEREEGARFDWIGLLQPTSPLRTAGDLAAAYELARTRAPKAVVSMCPAKSPPPWLKQLDADGRIAVTPPGAMRRQDVAGWYALNGSIYLVRRDVLLAEGTFFTDDTLGFVMPQERSLDVDTPFELVQCDVLLRERG
jgi:CMP-N-acetylneuraminic acid synthetase